MVPYSSSNMITSPGSPVIDLKIYIYIYDLFAAAIFSVADKIKGLTCTLSEIEAKAQPCIEAVNNI